MIFFDTETCGKHGPIVLLQWAEDDGEVQLHSVWTTPIKETIELIEYITYHQDGIVGFNLAFDWFHMCQTYTTLQLLDRNAIPLHIIDDYAIAEEQARFSHLCLKPVNALDLMLHARKGPYQSTMDRDEIRIKRVPTALAWQLASELNRRITFNDVYFARKQNKKERWVVRDINDEFGDSISEFKDVILKFAASSALKALAIDTGITDEETRLLYGDIELPKKMMPEELGYAPFALAIGQPGKWNKAWPEVIEHHISHWAFNNRARKYAEDDVYDTRDLYHYFDNPQLGDDDSILACMVGAVRWRGFSINIERIEELRAKAIESIEKIPFNFQAIKVVRRYLEEVMSETEKLAIRKSTKATVLEEISRWKEAVVCQNCKGHGCEKCEDGLIETNEMHPAAKRARLILDARHAKKEIENYDKLLRAKRFHASFIIIGTRSSRMSGADGFNAQGIQRAKVVRSCFSLADKDFVLCGGDFAGFEVCIADAVYNDPILRKDLQTWRPCHKCHGINHEQCTNDDCVNGQELTKFHALMGTFFFAPLTYEEILATKGLKGEHDKYGRSKNGSFALFYGGNEHTLANRVGIPIETGSEGYQHFINRYKGVGKARGVIFDQFCSMRQPGGIGTKVEWHEPVDFAQSLFGFKRYFILENRVCKLLFELANDPPKEWNRIRIKVKRRDREQTAIGAVKSALFACAFNIQAQNMRAAANHEIQSTGAEATKKVQRNIWNIQPFGINRWRVIPFNIHDEVIVPTLPQYVDEVSIIVKNSIEEMRSVIPLIAMDWHTKMKSWAEK